MFNNIKQILKKIFGIIFIIIGLFALITPLTPGAWIGLIGLELLGLRLVFEEKILKFFKKSKNKYYKK